jgi:hypothetical protein
MGSGYAGVGSVALVDEDFKHSHTDRAQGELHVTTLWDS